MIVTRPARVPHNPGTLAGMGYLEKKSLLKDDLDISGETGGLFFSNVQYTQWNF